MHFQSPIQYNEVISLVLLIWTIIYFYIQRDQLRKIPNWGYIFTALMMLIIGHIFTIVEGFWFHDLFNLIEHILHMVSAMFFALWTLLLISNKRRQKKEEKK